MSADRALRVSGLDLSYRVIGTGPPLLLVHGFGGASQDWNRWLDPLAAHFTLVVPDLRGHGRSTNPSSRFTHRESARDLLALLDDLGLASAAVVGFSAGGISLLHLAVLAPARVTHLAVIGGAHRLVASSRDALRRYRSLEALPDVERARYLDRHPGGPEQVRRLLRQFRDVADNVDDFALTRADLARVVAPTLLVFGERDGFYPRDVIDELHAWLPASRLWIVPDAGHLALWPEAGGSEAAADGFVSALLSLTRQQG